MPVNGHVLELVDAATLGRVVGVSRARIVNLAADGVLPRTDRNRFDLPSAVQAYLQHKIGVARAGDDTVRGLAAERSRLTKIKADAAEREAKVQAGELVPAADIEAAWVSVITAARAHLLVIPTKVAPRVAMKPPAEVRALLRKELHAALSALAAPPAI